MNLIKNFLIVGIGVHRRHQALHDAKLAVQHHGDRRQAVGGARGVGNDVVAGFKLVVVHAVNHCQINILARRGDQHLLGTSGDVGAGLGGIGEEAGAFQGDLHAHGGMGQLGRVTLGGDRDALAVHNDGITIHAHRAGKGAMHAVARQQAGVGLRARQIVDRHHFDIGAAGFDDGAQHVAADAPETVDCNFHSHVIDPS